MSQAIDEIPEPQLREWLARHAARLRWVVRDPSPKAPIVQSWQVGDRVVYVTLYVPRDGRPAAWAIAIENGVSGRATEALSIADQLLGKSVP